MKKRIPTFKTDEEAEKFVDTVDLTQFDLSDARLIRFEFKPKNKTISLRLPDELLQAIRGRAKSDGIPYQRLIRQALEREVG